jgi:predicted nucleotidyltransferase
VAIGERAATPKVKRGSSSMRIDEVLRGKREEIRQIATEHGARNVRIFGSIARGEAKSTSDVDVLIELEPGRTLLDIVAIKQDLEDLLGRKVDVVTEAAVSPYLRERVL